MADEFSHTILHRQDARAGAAAAAKPAVAGVKVRPAARPQPAAPAPARAPNARPVQPARAVPRAGKWNMKLKVHGPL